MQTELTWRMWLKDNKNRELLNESPSRAKKQFAIEQDQYRRKWHYLNQTYLSNLGVPSDSKAIGNFQIK